MKRGVVVKPRCVCGHKYHSEICKKERAGGWGKYRRAVTCKCYEYYPIPLKTRGQKGKK